MVRQEKITALYERLSRGVVCFRRLLNQLIRKPSKTHDHT